MMRRNSVVALTLLLTVLLCPVGAQACSTCAAHAPKMSLKKERDLLQWSRSHDPAAPAGEQFWRAMLHRVGFFVSDDLGRPGDVVSRTGLSTVDVWTKFFGPSWNPSTDSGRAAPVRRNARPTFAFSVKSGAGLLR